MRFHPGGTLGYRGVRRQTRGGNYGVQDTQREVMGLRVETRKRQQGTVRPNKSDI